MSIDIKTAAVEVKSKKRPKGIRIPDPEMFITPVKSGTATHSEHVWYLARLSSQNVPRAGVVPENHATMDDALPKDFDISVVVERLPPEISTRCGCEGHRPR